MRTTGLHGAFLVAALGAWPSGLAAQDATSPHGPLPEGLTCSSCHSTEAWSPLRPDAPFEHDRDGGYVLDGRHTAVSCVSCHDGLVFAASIDGEDCASCHADVHLGTATRGCASCHTTVSFTELPPGVVHPADFPLVGAHLQTTCEGCHVDDLGGAFAPLDQECASCHMADFASSGLVDHQALGFSTDCTECHSFVDFRDVPFDHFEMSGGFELIGAHAGIECTSCHSLPGGGVPAGSPTPNDCIACHLEEYQEKHGGSGVPTDCLQCHTVFTWDDAEFDHAATTGFELIAGHDLLCIECHVGSTGQTIYQAQGPEDCYACHALDYEGEHAGTGFSTGCLECHGSTTWQGATFDHAFPIAAGPHSGRECADCHVTPGDFEAFSCLTCHEHDQPSMDDRHKAEQGYVYESGVCLSCHPDGTR